MKQASFMKLTSFRKIEVLYWQGQGPGVYPTYYYCCEHCRTPCSYGPRNHMTQCGWAGCKQGKKVAPWLTK